MVVEHEMASRVRMTTEQMQAAAKDGAFIMFLYSQTFGQIPDATISNYAEAIRAIGPKSCIISTDLEGVVVKPPERQRPVGPQSLLDFMVALHKAGISVADINLMVKTNPAIALGLQP